MFSTAERSKRYGQNATVKTLRSKRYGQHHAVKSARLPRGKRVVAANELFEEAGRELLAPADLDLFDLLPADRRDIVQSVFGLAGEDTDAAIG